MFNVIIIDIIVIILELEESISYINITNKIYQKLKELYTSKKNQHVNAIIDMEHGAQLH